MLIKRTSLLILVLLLAFALPSSSHSVCTTTTEDYSWCSFCLIPGLFFLFTTVVAGTIRAKLVPSSQSRVPRSLSAEKPQPW